MDNRTSRGSSDAGTPRRGLRLASARTGSSSPVPTARRSSAREEGDPPRAATPLRTGRSRREPAAPRPDERPQRSRRAARTPRSGQAARRGTAGQPGLLAGIAAAVAGAIAAVVGTVINLFRPRPSRQAPSRARHPSPRRRGGSDQLRTTFRSGSAASASSSLRARGSMDGVRRGRGGQGRSSVIGQPLNRSYAARGRGSRPGMRLGGPRRGRSTGRPMAPALRPAALAVPCIALFLVLFIGSSFTSVPAAGIDPDTETALLDLPTLNPTAFPVSTPASEWKQGEMPHLYQTDPSWATLPYGGGTVAANACGPTVLTMLYVYFTGNTDMDPGSMATWADRHNYAPTGATEWAFMTEGAEAFGFSGTMVSPARSTVESALRDGNPVVCVVGPGDFTTIGHYIILKSIDDRALVEVYDPNSPERSARKWELVRVLNQTSVAWVYTSA